MASRDEDEVAILKGEVRLLKAALCAQMRFRHDLATCDCKGCEETRAMLGVEKPR